MASLNEMIFQDKQGGGGAAVKEGCRILATTFLSLLSPLSVLLAARLSAARYFLSFESSDGIYFPVSLSLLSKATAIFSLLIAAVAVAALLQCLTGKKPYFLTGKRRRFCGAWILLFVMLICLNLGIHATVDAGVDGRSVGGIVLPRRLVLVLGLHEVMVFWRRNVVEPVVDEVVSGFSGGEGFRWVEKAALAVAFGYLWWRRLRDEAEALALLPWIRAELEMEVEVADVVGWLLYYLTAAIGGVKVVKVLLGWLICRKTN